MPLCGIIIIIIIIIIVIQLLFYFINPLKFISDCCTEGSPYPNYKSIYRTICKESRYLASDWQDHKRIMNWKGFGRKQPWPNLTYFPETCLVVPRISTNNNNQYSQWDWNRWPSDCKPEASLLEVTCSEQNKIYSLLASLSMNHNSENTSMRI
jgi:hypothetical protein